MRLFLSVFASVSLAVLTVVVATGSALAEDEIMTVTGQVVAAEKDAAGNEIVTIVTETDTYLIHENSKASDIRSQAGKTVKAMGKVEVTELSKTISVDEFALVEGDMPPVGAK